jgi:UDP-N-acetylmuramate--alanine ligase
MHIFFSGIGGTGIGPLALLAKQAGFMVSGSDKQSSQYTEYLEKHGIDLYIGQTKEKLISHHQHSPIDWFVYSSALPLENPHHPELQVVNELDIKHSKRDEFLQYFLKEKNLQLIAIAGTH